MDIRPAPASRTATAGTSPKPARLSNSAPVRAELPNPAGLEAGSRADQTEQDVAIEGSPPLPPTRQAPDVVRAESSNPAILGAAGRGPEAIWSSSLPPAAAKVEEIRTPWRTSTGKEQKHCKIVEELFLLGEVWKDLFSAPATSPG